MRNQPAPAGSERPVIRPGGEIFRFTPGRDIHVDVRINDSVSARLILDTGAGQTMISPHILAADMGARDAEGLLGQDFLGHFNVSIDPARGIVTLKPR